MQTKTDDECVAWCAERGIRGPSKRHLEFVAESKAAFEIALPTTGLELVGLSAVLCSQLDEGGHPPSLLWLTDWGMWSEAFDEAGIRTWERLLGSYGVSGPLTHSIAGLKFTRDEGLDQRVFLATALLFQWDVSLVPDHGKYMVIVSHDGFVRVTGQNAEVAGELERRLHAWTAGPKPAPEAGRS